MSRPLSQRQIDILMLVASGETRVAIAELLGMSERGVYRQLKRARDQYGARSLNELIAMLSGFGHSSADRCDGKVVAHESSDSL